MSKNVFGPVLSRRLGLSLGIDLTPFKTCTYNCVYCQLSITTNCTIERKSFFEPTKIIAEIEKALESGRTPDYITFSGSGEPTLSSDLGLIIKNIKSRTDIPVCVITNGSLMWREDVAADLALADIVIPTLDAASEEAWRAMNDPSGDLDLQRMLRGIMDFCEKHGDKVWMEVMLVDGVNDTDKELEAIADFVRRAKVAKVQLNTIGRPPRVSNLMAVDPARLAEIAEKFDFGAPVEMIVANPAKRKGTAAGDLPSMILEMLIRHPATADEMAEAFGRDIEEVVRAGQKLLAEGKAELVENGGGLGPFYRIPPPQQK